MKTLQQQKNEELFSALTADDEVNIKPLIDQSAEIKANVNSFDAKHGTPLICAVKAHRKNHVIQLLDAKADVLGVDQAWHSALHHAFAEFKAVVTKKSKTIVVEDDEEDKDGKEEQASTPRQTRLDILFLLIRHLPSIDAEKIQQWVLRTARYWHDPTYVQSKTLLLDAVASCLLGSNVNVFCKEKFLIKYVAQILSFKGTAKDNQGTVVDAENWSKDIYLVLRIRVLVGMLLTEREKPNLNSQQEEKTHKIISEIQITIETYFITMLCTQIQDLNLDEKKKNYFTNCSLIE